MCNVKLHLLLFSNKAKRVLSNLQIVRSKLAEGTGQVGFLQPRSLPLPQEDEDVYEEIQ